MATTMLGLEQCLGKASGCMRTHSQGPSESVVPSTWQSRCKQADLLEDSLEEDLGRDGDPLGVSGASSSLSRGQGHSCPPLWHSWVGRPMAWQPHSPAVAARQLFLVPSHRCNHRRW